jgi:hypothetical protein
MVIVLRLRFDFSEVRLIGALLTVTFTLTLITHIAVLMMVVLLLLYRPRPRPLVRMSFFVLLLVLTLLVVVTLHPGGPLGSGGDILLVLDDVLVEQLHDLLIDLVVH